MPPRISSLLVVGALAAASPLTFVADVGGSQALLNFAILDCVGTGHAALALRADYRSHLSNVQRDIGFRSIRGHGILDDDMSTFLNGATNSEPRLAARASASRTAPPGARSDQRFLCPRLLPQCWNQTDTRTVLHARGARHQFLQHSDALQRDHINPKGPKPVGGICL